MREPDLTAPRFRYKSEGTLNSAFIKKFKEKYPHYADYEDKVLTNAIKEHNKLIWNTVVNTRDGVELQSGLGFLFVGMAPSPKKRPIAWKKSQELGVKVYHKNWETDNRIAKIVYSNYMSRFPFKYKELWYFSAVRQFKRRVAEKCTENWRNYVSLSADSFAWQLFDRRMYRDKMKKRTDKFLDYYNEFNV